MKNEKPLLNMKVDTSSTTERTSAPDEIVTEDEKRRIRRNSLIKILAMLLFTLIVLVFSSIAWFTTNKENSATGMGVRAATDVFTIFPLSGNGVTPGVFADKLSEAEDLTAKNGAMTWTMTQDYHLVNVQSARNVVGVDTSDLDELGLRPGTYGEIRFQLTPSRPKVDAQFTFDLYAFEYQESNSNGQEGNEQEGEEETVEEGSESLVLITNTNDSQLLDLIKGHILLFGARDGNPGAYQYSDLILSSDMTTRLKTAQYTGAQTVSIYWVWPDTLAEILMPTGSRQLNGKVNLCKDSDTATKINAYFKAHPEYLFYDESTNSYSEFKAASNIAEYLADGHYDEYSSLYNNADQFIGTRVGYLMLYMNSEGSEHID